MIPGVIEGIGVGVVAVVFTVVNGLHVFVPWLAAPKGTLFTGIAHYYADYFFYISHIAEGMAGHMTVAGSRFTNEPMGRSTIYWFYVMLGNAGKLVSGSPFFLYNAALAVCVAALVVVWYGVVRITFPASRALRFLGLLLILTATSLVDMGKWLTTGEIATYGYFWFSPALAFNRLGGVPHQVFQTIIMVAAVAAAAAAIERQRVRNLSPRAVMILSAVSALATLSNPTQMLLIVMAVGLYTAGSVILSGCTLRSLYPAAANLRRIAADPRRLVVPGIPVIVMGFSALPVALYVLSTFGLPTYVAAKQWELSQHTVVSVVQFILAVGPVSVFIPLGVVPVMTNRRVLPKLLLLYAGISLVFFFTDLPALFETARPRFLHPASYAAFPLMATMGMAVVARVVAGIVRVKEELVRRSVLAVIVVLYGVFTYPGLFQQIDARVNPVHNPILASSVERVPSGVAEAMAVLAVQPSQQPVVVTDPVLPYDVLVPAMTPDKVSFTGHPIHTLYGATKESIRTRIFSGTVSRDDLASIIHNHRIGYFLVSSAYDRPAMLTKFPFVSVVTRNGAVTLLRAEDTLR